MKCTTCLYPLWRIRGRQCPECGAAFKPSEFEFVLNSVRFSCPHCEQEYYGDGERGHLNPVEFDCVKCGTHVHMDEMVLSPAAGVEEARTEVEKLPWLERGRGGWWKSWFKTLGLALTAPRDAMKMTPVESSAGHAIRFFVWTQVLVLVVTFIPMLLLFAVIGVIGVFAGGAGGGGGGPGAGAMAGIMSGTMGAMLLAAVVSVTVFFGVFTLMAHGILAITGPTFGLKRTLHAMAYSSGANIATAAPCVGGYVGWIWWLVSAVIMVKEAHAAKWWRAVLAVVGPVVGTLAILITAYVFFVIAMMGTVNTARVSAQQLSQLATTKQLGGSLIAAAQRDGSWPKHAAELVRDSMAMPQDFVLTGLQGTGMGVSAASKTTADLVTVGGVSLSVFQIRPTEGQNMLIREELKAIGPEAAAYRLGDMVVCLRDSDPTDAPMAAWLLVAWPDPSVNVGDPTTVGVVLADGSANNIAIADFDAALKAQNELRAKAELKPLPHPRDVQTGGDAVEKEPEGP